MLFKKQSQKKNYTMDISRLESFSDGVFAIAITLLVLEIKIPKHEELMRYGSLYHYLGDLWPSYLSWAISFMVVGVAWSNHHWMFDFIRKTNHFLNLLNIFFLMSVAFVPFTSAVLGDFVEDPVTRSAAVSAYTIGFSLPFPTGLVIIIYATYKHKLVDPRLSQKFINKQIFKVGSVTTLSIIAFILSFYFPLISLAIIVGMLILFMLPPEQPYFESQHK